MKSILTLIIKEDIWKKATRTAANLIPAKQAMNPTNQAAVAPVLSSDLFFNPLPLLSLHITTQFLTRCSKCFMIVFKKKIVEMNTCKKSTKKCTHYDPGSIQR